MKNTYHFPKCVSTYNNEKQTKENGKMNVIENEKETIRGTFSWPVSVDWNSGWCVYKYEGDQEYREKYGVKYFTLCGIDLPTIGIQHEFEVMYDANASYSGRSFRCVSCKESPVGSKVEAAAWLCSSIFNGIGKKKAVKIVEALGPNTIELVKADLNILKTVGITQKAFEKIEKSYNSYYSLYQEYDFLRTELGLSENEIKKVRKKLSLMELEDVESYVREDPYVLYRCANLNFNIVDQFALRNGVPKDDYDRIYVGVLEVLKRNETEGHTYIKGKDLVNKTLNLLCLDARYAEFVQRIILNQITNNRYNTDIFAYNSSVDSGFALTNTMMMELDIVNFVLADNTPPVRNSTKIGWNIGLFFGNDIESDQRYDALLDEAIERNTPEGMTLDPSQIDAVKLALKNRFSIITGGPGTGKTTITNVLISVYRDLTGYDESHIELVAPTGAAAKRLSEKSGYKAKTINSRFCIGVDREDNNDEDKETFFLSRECCDIKNALLIVDEASMLDLFTASNFLQYVDKESVHVVFVGDKDQLPPVACGSVFVELLKFFKECGSLIGRRSVAYLSVTHRQAESSGIVSSAMDINYGRYREAQKSNSEYEIVNVEQNGSVSKFLSDNEDKLMAVALEQIEEYGLNETMVLCPQNEGVCGVYSVNKRLQEVLNPKINENDSFVSGIHGYEFRVGDRVMHLKNNKDVVNGDVGYVTRIETKGGNNNTMVVSYSTPDGPVEYKYTRGNMDEVCLCYVQTVHKAQGSEYASVVVCLNSAQPFSLKRNLFYTAVTRAKEHCCVVGDSFAISKAVAASLSAVRYSKICTILKYAVTNKINYVNSCDVAFAIPDEQ